MNNYIIFIILNLTIISHCQKQECSEELHKKFYNCISPILLEQDDFLSDHIVYVEVNENLEIVSHKGELNSNVKRAIEETLSCVKESLDFSELRFIFYHKFYPRNSMPEEAKFYNNKIDEFKRDYNIDMDVCDLQFGRHAKVQ